MMMMVGANIGKCRIDVREKEESESQGDVEGIYASPLDSLQLRRLITDSLSMSYEK